MLVDNIAVVDNVKPQRADTATLLDVAVHVGGHPWTLTSRKEEVLLIILS